MNLSETKYLPKVDHTPAELDAVSKMLLRIASHIEDHGLSCGGMTDDQGRPCLVRTIGIVEKKNPEFDGLYYKALFRIDDAAPKIINQIGLGGWSDSTPAPEMVSFLRKVALGL